MLEFLPNQVKSEIYKATKSPYEIRIRADKPITVKGSNGLTTIVKTLCVSMGKREIEQAVLRLCNHAIYSVEESLRMGFITSKNGERVGVCGELVYNGQSVVAIKNFSSLSVRFPHYVFGCSEEYSKALVTATSCLIISPPFHGKTTFIRDLGRVYSDKFNLNVLYIDERDELSLGGSFNLGKNSDVLRYSNKSFGFYNGVRAYNPDVIICDELMTGDDCNSVEFAMASGVKVVASAHSSNLENLLKKKEISKIIQKNTFEDIILLDRFKIKEIYKEQDWQKYF